MLTLVLLLLAAICFALGAANVAAKVNWIAAGLLCWVLTAIIPSFH